MAAEGRSTAGGGTCGHACGRHRTRW
jgi:hypothetical protein